MSWSAIQVGLSANFLIGPILYVYIKSIFSDNFSLKLRYKIKIILPFLIIISLGILYPFEEHKFVWDNKIRYFIHAFLSCFLIITSIVLINPVKKLYITRVPLKPNQNLGILVFISSVLICIGFVISLYTSYINGALIFSLIFYFSVLLVLFNREIFLPKQKVQNQKYQNKKISKSEAASLNKKLEQIMTVQKLYLNPDFKLADLGKELKLGSHKASQLLNDNIGKSFAEYINEFRIEEAKELIKNSPDKTLDAIGFDSGFSSKSSFYSIFKKYTQMTPASFRDSLKNVN